MGGDDALPAWAIVYIPRATTGRGRLDCEDARKSGKDICSIMNHQIKLKYGREGSTASITSPRKVDPPCPDPSGGVCAIQ